MSRPASFQKPIERDTGQLLYVGHLVAHGATPYADAALNKGPFAFLTFAVIDTVTFTKVVLVRLVLVAFVAAAALGVAVVVESRAGRSAGLVAGIALALLAAAHPIQGDDPNTEQFGIAFLAGAWGLAALPGVRAALWSGVVLAAGIAFNPLFAVVAPVVAWELLVADRPLRVRRVVVAAGGAAVLLGLLLLWLGLAGALDDMWDQVVGRSVPVLHGAQAGASGASGVGKTLQDLLDVPGGALYWLGLAGAALALHRRELRPTAIGALAWILLVWGRTELQSYTFPHHFYIALPGIIVGIGLGLASLGAIDMRGRLPLAALVLVAPFVTFVAGPQVRQLEVPPNKRWQLDAPIDWSLSYPVAQFIRDHTRPGDRVYLAGSNPEVYWLAHRRAASRYFDWFIPLRDRAAAAARLRDLDAHPPAAIGVMPNPDAQDDVQGFRRFMNSHRYVIAYEVAGAQVWLPRQTG